MSAKSSKGVQICLTGPISDSTSSTSITATGITPGNPTVIAAINNATAGDIVSFPTNTAAGLANKYFVAGPNTTTSSIELLGSDTTDYVVIEPFSAVGNLYKQTTCLCLSALAINPDTPGTISVGTYCDPTATVSSVVVKAGTLTFNGYVDVNAQDYPAVLKAEEDGLERLIRIELPGNGWIVAPLTVSQITWDLPLDGAIGFSGTATLGSKPVHRF
jgi:hypothetical protein